MSKGLNYLATMRPEAISGLLKFYGKSVQALDDKTRLLISIVTKVAAGTERGLRQYAPRAIKAGASKEELLDAVLMAFPAAGLTKVVDAVQTLLSMDLLPNTPSEKQEDALPAAKEYDLGPLDHFPLAKMTSVSTEAGTMLVYRVDAEAIRVYSANCPHAKGDLSQGKCEGAVIECPVHHWKFNLESGKNLKEKLAGLREYASEIREGNVFIKVA